MTSIQFLLAISIQNHTLTSLEWRKWSPTRDALDYETISTCQHLRDCLGNSMENIHVDVRVERVKNQSKCMCGVAFLVNFITICVFECFFSCSFNPVFRSSLWYKQKWSITNSSIEEWQTSSGNIQKCDSGLYSIASVDLLINNQKQVIF